MLQSSLQYALCFPHAPRACRGLTVCAAAAAAVALVVLFLCFVSSKVGRASLKLNAASAGECECEWMKRDVSATLLQKTKKKVHEHVRSYFSTTAVLVVVSGHLDVAVCRVFKLLSSRVYAPPPKFFDHLKAWSLQPSTFRGSASGTQLLH